VAKRLNLKMGSQVTFIAGDKEIPVKVAAIYKIVGEHAFARSEFILPKALLADQPAVWYGDIHARPTAIPEIERALFATYPTVTVINIADILQTITGVVDQITMVIRFLAGFSILSGLVILASSVASTRFRRMREVVVLKTLGATRNRIATVFSVEFVVLGLLAGAVGALFANVLSRILLHRMDVVFQRGRAGIVDGGGGQRRCWRWRQDGLRASTFWDRSRWKFCVKSEEGREAASRGNRARRPRMQAGLGDRRVIDRHSRGR
jgi:putative ABC transport system permease protein